MKYMIVGALLAAPFTVAQADEPLNLSLGAKAGTLGVGAELGYAFSDRFALRVGGYGYAFDVDGEESGVEYDGDLDLSSAGIWADWHPFDLGFRVTAGWLSHDNGVDATGVPGEGGVYEIGGGTFTAAEIGTLKADVDFGSSAPYLGLGWDWGTKDAGLGFHLDLGVLFQDSPDATLTATGGTLSGDPLLQDALDEEEAELEDELDKYDLYPVLSVGLSYSF